MGVGVVQVGDKQPRALLRGLWRVPRAVEESEMRVYTTSGTLSPVPPSLVAGWCVSRGQQETLAAIQWVWAATSIH